MKHKTFRELAGEIVGEASMCWTETPHGIFDSTRASSLVDKLVAAHEKIYPLEAMIFSHIDAMRPLLDQWADLKKARGES